MMPRAPFALVPLLAMAACAPPLEDATTSRDGHAEGDVAFVPVVRDLGAAELAVARLVLDLDTTIGRFVEPARALPLERVQLRGTGREPVELDDVLERCNALEGYEITGGAQFVVGQGEGFIAGSGADACVVCGWAVICPGACDDLGPGDVRRRGDPTQYDVDPPEDDGTGSTGGSSGSTGGSSGTDDAPTGSSSGGSTGGTGGAGGGVGNPGWD